MLLHSTLKWISTTEALRKFIDEKKVLFISFGFRPKIYNYVQTLKKGNSLCNE